MQFFFPPFFPQKTIGIINVSEEPNWCSLMRRCGGSVLSVSCHPLCPRLSDRGGLQSGLWSLAQAQQCDSNSITMIPVIINGAAENIGICSAQADEASLSMRDIPHRLQQLRQMFWVVWLVRGVLREKGCRQMCDWTVYLYGILSHKCHLEKTGVLWRVVICSPTRLV